MGRNDRLGCILQRIHSSLLFTYVLSQRTSPYEPIPNVPSMKGGGVIEDEVWWVRAKTLRPLDHIRCENWVDPMWAGGEEMVVLFVQPDKRSKGYLRITTQSADCPDHLRDFVMLPDDGVVMLARDVPLEEQTRVPKQGKTPKLKQPRKGQLKLF